MIDFSQYSKLNSVQRGAVLELVFLHKVDVVSVEQINRYVLYGEVRKCQRY